MNIGKAIKLCRIQKGITQKELSKICGLSASYLTLIENNKQNINLVTLEKICLGLKVPMTVLIFLSKDSDGETGLGKELSEKLSALALSAIGGNDE